tara:strand:+ start:15787 stop:18456 length:2670 start_codon:yes stop_codon:yes gene_type:complete
MPVITNAGEYLITQQQQAGEPLIIDQMILANITGLDSNTVPSREQSMPAPEDVKIIKPITKDGLLNTNTVVYSTVFPSTDGTFDFNYMGLYSSAHDVIVAVAYVPLQTKIKTVGTDVGNVITKNFAIEFNAAADITGINISAESWQIDYTARLLSMDKHQRDLVKNIYGPSTFLNDAFKVKFETDKYYLTAGKAILGGINFDLEADLEIVPGALPQTVWLDVYQETSMMGVLNKHDVVFNDGTVLADYVVGSVEHTLVKLGVVNSSVDIVDERSLVKRSLELTTKNNDPKNIAELRKYRPEYAGQKLDIDGHTLPGIGGGPFYHDPDDSTSPDNNGTVIVNEWGDRWKRILDGYVTPEMFNGDFTAASRLGVVLAQGEYLVSGVDLADGCRLLANGAVFTGHGLTSDMFRAVGSLVIDGGTFTNARTVVNIIETSTGSGVTLTGGTFNNVAHAIFGRKGGFADNTVLGDLRVKNCTFMDGECFIYTIHKSWRTVSVSDNIAEGMSIKNTGERVFPYHRYNVGFLQVGATFSGEHDDIKKASASNNKIKDVHNSLIDPYTGLDVSESNDQETQAIAIRCGEGTVVVDGNTIEDLSAVAANTDCEAILVRARSGVINGNVLRNAGTDEAAISCKYSFTDGLRVTGNNISWTASATGTRTGCLISSDAAAPVIFSDNTVVNSLRAVTARSNNFEISRNTFKDCATVVFLGPEHDIDSLSIIDNTMDGCQLHLEHIRTSINGRFPYLIGLVVCEMNRVVNPEGQNLFSFPIATKTVVCNNKIISSIQSSLRPFLFYGGDTDLASEILVSGNYTTGLGGGDGRVFSVVGGTLGFGNTQIELSRNESRDQRFFVLMNDTSIPMVRCYNNIDIGTTEANSYNFGTTVNSQQQNITF